MFCLVNGRTVWNKTWVVIKQRTCLLQYFFFQIEKLMDCRFFLKKQAYSVEIRIVLVKPRYFKERILDCKEKKVKYMSKICSSDSNKIQGWKQQNSRGFRQLVLARILPYAKFARAAKTMSSLIIELDDNLYAPLHVVFPLTSFLLKSPQCCEWSLAEH